MIKKLIGLYLLIVPVIIFSCNDNNASDAEPADSFSLSANAFAEKVKQNPGAAIIDVRTPEEFSKGHLQNAINISVNSNDFDNELQRLDKSKPVFVYCLSGARSAAAANTMRSANFKQVYELEGGIIKWRNAGLPEASNNDTAPINGMSTEQFNALLNSDKTVLIDFYADWCGPCNIMKPSINEIATAMANKVSVIRINADDNQELLKALHIEALPTLHIYKNKTLVWQNVGLTEKQTILQHLQ